MTLFLLLAVVASAMLAQTPPSLRVNMISIGVTDMDRSIHFYTETLGLPMPVRAAKSRCSGRVKSLSR